MVLRLGYFEQFKWGNTILLSVDKSSLKELLKLLTDLMLALNNQIRLTDLSFVQSFNQTKLDLYVASDSNRIYKKADAFVLELTEEGWGYVRDSLTPLLAGVSGHQYVDLPIQNDDDLQLMISLGEYPDDWVGWTQ